MVCCSLGVLFWEICTREIPVRGMLRPLRVPEECSQEVAQLIEVCMHFDPDLRPHARGVRPPPPVSRLIGTGLWLGSAVCTPSLALTMQSAISAGTAMMKAAGLFDCTQPSPLADIRPDPDKHQRPGGQAAFAGELGGA